MSRADNNDICAQINELIGDLSGMELEMNAASESALDKAAAVIRDEQRRIFAKANFKRTKKNQRYKFANGSLIKIQKKQLGKGKIRAYVGFDTETLKEYPELLVIEFGRPGKSPRRSSDTEEVKGLLGRRKRFTRKKGIFPDYAVVMPIRMGLELTKDSALQAYADALFEKAEELFRGQRN